MIFHTWKNDLHLLYWTEKYTAEGLPVYQIYRDTPWWYRKCSSGVPNELRGKKQHSWFSFTNLGVWYNRLRSKWLLFRVKKGAFDTRKVITNWGRVQKATFFTRWIGPKSSSFPCLLVYCMTTMKIKPLTYKLSHRMSTGRNYLNISTIKQKKHIVTKPK